MKLKLNIDNFSLLCFAGILLIPHAFRTTLFPDIIAALNIFGMLGVMLMYKRVHKSRRQMPDNISIICIVLSLIICAIHLLDNPISFIKIFFSIFLPTVTLSLLKISVNDGKRMFRVALRVFDISVAIIFVLTILDFATGHLVGRVIANYYNTIAIDALIRQNRLVTPYGHSLVTMLIMISYLIMHVLDSLYISRKGNVIWPTIVSIVVIAATGSKTGCLIAVFILLVCYVNKTNIKYFPLIVFSIFIVYYLGYFDLLLERLNIGVESGDITTGRLTAYYKLSETGILKFDLFAGQDANLINNSSAMIAALENPFMRWAFLYGIVYSFLMAIGVVIMPVIKIACNKNWKITFLTVLYIVAINSFDTICSVGDSMLLYCLMLVMFNVAAKASVTSY